MSAEAIKGDILDFVWIEKYRNIKKQGFNLSNKYAYHYDENSRILTRYSNNSYINSFLGEKIEFNAIVGMNGVGKTALLSALINCFCKREILLNLTFY